MPTGPVDPPAAPVARSAAPVDPLPARVASTAGANVPRERRTVPVELLWDLVFVFAVTQVTTLLADHASWPRFGEAMLALALVWWAWSAFVWAANAYDSDSRVLRAHLLAATVLIFVVGLALPHAYGDEGLTFAAAYALVRVIHLSLYGEASRRGRAAWSAIAGFGVTVVIAIALLIAGALVAGWGRAALWTAAVAIDYAGPAWLTRDKLRGLQQVAVAHFADRYGDFIIICLGESIVSIGVGVGATRRHLTPGLTAAAALGLLIAVGMWWTYFDRLAEAAQERLRRHADPVLAAADSFSYLHLVIVAGIIVYASGIRLIVHNAIGAPMPGPGRLAFLGGVSLYLVGLSAFRLRLLGQRSPGRLGVAAALMALYALGGGAPAWSLTVVATALVAALCVAELVAAARAPEATAARADTVAAPAASTPSSQGPAPAPGADGAS